VAVNGPNWTIVEQPAKWDYTSTGPDRSACGASQGKVYNVGPGQQYPNPHDVPWMQLMPCDQINIYYRAQAYNDVVFVISRGRKGQAITIHGVLGPAGERPVFDGSHAVMPTNVYPDTYEIGYGMINIVLPDIAHIAYAYGYKPGYLIVENLEITNAFGKYPGTNQPIYGYTDIHGTFVPWPGFTSGIYINPAEHVTLRNNYAHGNGLGFFVNSLNGGAGQSRDFYVADNTLVNNGNGDAHNHNYYPEVIGERVIHNHFGPPILHTGGENIKDRSVCVEYRDNYIDSGNSLISFRDPQSNGPYEVLEVDAFGQKCAANLFVHDNTFVARGPQLWQEASIVIGFGDGNVANPPTNRFGEVDFYGNVVLAIGNRDPWSMRAVPLFQNSNTAKATTFMAVDDMFYSTPMTPGAAAMPIAACYYGASVTLTSVDSNLPMVPTFATAADGVLATGVKCNQSAIAGDTLFSGSPGFVNFAAGDYHVTPASPFASLNAPIPAAAQVRGLVRDFGSYP
jgi:hypothetical protein